MNESCIRQFRGLKNVAMRVGTSLLSAHKLIYNISWMLSCNVVNFLLCMPQYDRRNDAKYLATLCNLSWAKILRECTSCVLIFRM